VQAALTKAQLGLADNWIRHIQDVHQQHGARIDALGGIPARVNRLCELNVIEQVSNVCRTSIVEDAWRRGQALSVHGWIYGIEDGLLRDLDATASSIEDSATAYKRALALL
jgi:carbonic anhydrase